MHLIASPLQKQFYTYLPKSPIYKRYSVADLPISYHNLVNQQNGGYTSHSYVASKRPSRDALTAVYIPYIAGMYEQKLGADYHIPSITRQKDFVHRPNIPDTGIIFYEDHDRVAYFDFSQVSDKGEPAVAYMDVGLGQVSILAPDFASFLDLFEHRFLGLPAPTLVSYHRVNVAILQANSFQEIADLLADYGPLLGQKWQNDWQDLLAHFGTKPFDQFQAALNTYSQGHKSILSL